MSWPISGVGRSEIRDLKEVKEEARGEAASVVQMTCLAPGQAVGEAEQRGCLPSRHTEMGESS